MRWVKVGFGLVVAPALEQCDRPTHQGATVIGSDRECRRKPFQGLVVFLVAEQDIALTHFVVAGGRLDKLTDHGPDREHHERGDRHQDDETSDDSGVGQGRHCGAYRFPYSTST